MPIQNALTVDVEDYYQVSGFEGDIRRVDWDGYPSRVVGNTKRILDLLAHHRIRATFFVLGWVAEKYPKLVREIDAAGHEIGSHSYWHRLVYRLTPEEFRDDLCRSRDVLEEIIGKSVVAYRSPSFSIRHECLWAFDILVEEGFTYDSSIFPIHHDRYGMPDAPREPHLYKTPRGHLKEFPASVARLGNFNLPIAGGGYFRLYPYRLTSFFLNQLNKINKPFVFYLHPWELDPEQPRLPAGGASMRFRHYVNLKSTEAKFCHLLSQFHFGRLDEVLDTCLDVGSRSARLATEFAP